MASIQVCINRSVAAVVMVFAFGSGAVLAAPQILAVAASNAPIPFHCENGVCEVEISAMCLQENRRFPDSQTVYTPFDEQSFSLVYHDQNGEEHRILAGDLATIRSKRSFTAVRIAIPETTLKDLGTDGLSLQVAGGASLIPADVEHDFHPQTAADIAEATGPHREHAAGWLDASDERTLMSRFINRVLNGLPRSGALGRDDIEQSWTKGAATSGDLDADVRVRAEAVYDRCVRLTTNRTPASVRRCLEQNHDSLLYRMNVEYWDSLKTGS